MNILETKLAARFLFPKRTWLESLVNVHKVTTEQAALSRLLEEDFRQVIDTSKLQKYVFSQETRLMTL